MALPAVAFAADELARTAQEQDRASLFSKVTDGVDVAPLLEQLDAQPELWDQFNYRKVSPGTPHSQMSDIWVHYNDIKNLGLRFNEEHVAVWYPSYYKLPALKHILFPLMAMVEGSRLGFVLITRIPPGGKIGPHCDAGWHVDYFDKFYVSLRSNPKAGFYSVRPMKLGGPKPPVEALFPQAGEIWRFDNRYLHWVENDGDTDRITLIVCIRTEKYEKHPQLGGRVYE